MQTILALTAGYLHFSIVYYTTLSYGTKSNLLNNISDKYILMFEAPVLRNDKTQLVANKINYRRLYSVCPSDIVTTHALSPKVFYKIILATKKEIYENTKLSAANTCHKFYAIAMQLTRFDGPPASTISLKCIIILNILITQMDILEASYCQNMSFIKMY